jgi:hypothetical protein
LDAEEMVFVAFADLDPMRWMSIFLLSVAKFSVSL